MTALVIAQAVAILILGVLVAGLLRSHATILQALHALGVDLDPDRLEPSVPAPRPAPAGGRARDVAGVRPNGDAVQIGLGGRGTTLLAFLTTGCATCARFWEAFAEGPPTDLPAGAERLVIVTKGLEDESPARLEELAPPGITTVATNAAWSDYRVPVSPYFILVSDGDVAGEGAAATWPQVASLLSQALRDQRVSSRRGGNGRQRHVDIDAELAAAGVTPGHPSLYPPPHHS